MWKSLMFALSLLTLSATVAAQERKPWSFYVEGGAGIQQLAELQNIEIPEGDAKAYLNQRGIYSLDITTGIERPVVANFNIGASYNFQSFLQGRSRVSLHMGNQNISQQSYHATVFSAEMLFGYDFFSHPHHDLSVELGLGMYATFNRMNYTWRGLDGEGKQIYIGGVPEQITVNLGQHNTVQPSIPLRVSYAYNIAAHSWIGAYAQGRYIPKHDTYVPTLTASVGVTYRFTLGGKKKHYVKPEPKPLDMRTRTHIDTVYINNVSVVHDTVYVREVMHSVDTVYIEKEREQRLPIYVLFELNSSELTEYETKRLNGIDFSSVKSVELNGCACSIGRNTYNIKLAGRRVKAVKALLEKRGVQVSATRTAVGGFAAPNFRSVEIKFIEK